MNRLNLRDIASLDSLIAGAARITVIGHMKPDGDAVGSGVAMLSFLEVEEAPSPVVPVLFRFRLAADLGYVPEMQVCARCGRALTGEEQTYFLVGEGAACCSRCRRSGDMSLSLGQEALDVLGKVKEYSPESWGMLKPSPEGARQAARLIDAFVRYHLGLEWSNGRFRSL